MRKVVRRGGYNRIKRFCWGIIILLISCTRETAGDEVFPAEVFYDYATFELELLDLVNTHRISAGLNQLDKLDDISHQALLHNKHMIEAGEVCHHNFGSRYSELAKTVGAKAMGENVGYGYRTAEAFLTAWIKSSEHKKILTGNHTHFGISAQQAEEKMYVTLIFIRR